MDLKDYIVDQNTSILDAMNMINKNAKGIVYVCNDRKLNGALTDGNIRRHILNGGSLNATVMEVANLEPKFLTQGSNVEPVTYMQSLGITSVPVLNEKGQVISIRFSDNNGVYDYKQLNVPVVIMAGGKGTRLKPFTDVLPKPLIPIGEKTITERIMDRFKAFGCDRFNIIVNYKKELIKAYFKDLNEYNVTFTDEDIFLGTAGGLNLISDKVDSTFFLTNCDIIVDDNYFEIFRQHKESKAIITLICTMKKYQIPYGTVSINKEGSVTGINEKPEYSFLVNTGMYVIEPEFLKYVPADQFIHITDVIMKCTEAGEKIGMYPISENAWMDMGEKQELENMRKRFI